MRGDGGRARTALRKCGHPWEAGQSRAGGEAGRAGVHRDSPQERQTGGRGPDLEEYLGRPLTQQ